MMRILVLAIVIAVALTASGCTWNTKPEEALPRTTVVEVPVTRIEKCVKPEDVEPVPGTAMRKDGDVMQDAAGAVADAKTFRALAQRQSLLLRNCIKTQ